MEKLVDALGRMRKVGGNCRCCDPVSLGLDVCGRVRIRSVLCYRLWEQRGLIVYAIVIG